MWTFLTGKFFLIFFCSQASVPKLDVKIELPPIQQATMPVQPEIGIGNFQPSMVLNPSDASLQSTQQPSFNAILGTPSVSIQREFLFLHSSVANFLRHAKKFEYGYKYWHFFIV